MANSEIRMNRTSQTWHAANQYSLIAIQHSAFRIPHSTGGRPRRLKPAARLGFTLVELLTVIAIIALLIGILIPSLTAARNAAKKSRTATTIKAAGEGLELFKNDNQREFPQSNGYPPSFAHPPIGTATFDSYKGQCPFLPAVSEDSPPTMYGAQWLYPMLVGFDNLGFVPRSSVPERDNIRNEPWKWYSADPLTTGKPLSRKPLYLDLQGLRTAQLSEVHGRPNYAFFPEWEQGDEATPGDVQSTRVILDSFEQPILYYASTSFGKATNMVQDVHRQDNNYDQSGVQQQGNPYYFHQDNAGFTGGVPPDGGAEVPGWIFSTGTHAITKSGHDLTGDTIRAEENQSTFARFVIDRKILRALKETQNANENAPLKPAHSDTFLLISAGADSRYGTQDDVTNFPLEE